MKVTGYKLREALRRWQLRRDAAVSQFEGTLVKFKDEAKSTPDEVAERIAKAENAMTQLQVAQTLYNSRVHVSSGSGSGLLLTAVKAVGPLTRAEKMWRSAAGIETKKRHVYSVLASNTRSKDNEVALPTITPDEAAKQAEAAGRKLSKLREAIAGGNTTELDIEDLDPALLE